MGYARSPDQFFGRDAELGALESFFQAGVESGRGTGAFVHGPGGIGKTALVEAFIARSRKLFPAGIQRYPPPPARPEAPEGILEDVALVAAGFDPRDAGLLILDEAERADPMQLGTLLGDLWNRRPQANVIITARLNLSMPPGWLDLQLDALPAKDLEEFLTAQIALNEASVHTLTEHLQGNPRLASIIAGFARKGENLAQLLGRLEPSTYSGLLDLDGQPLDPGSALAGPARIKLHAVSEDLVERIAARPELVHQLTPRQFEEFVAALYERHGFEVELTPASKDGGVDLYAARHEAFGTCLTVVECKRNSPDRPIGVELVRSLYGVLEDKGASFGVLATTSSFTGGAKDFQRRNEYRLGLQDWFDLQDMLRGSIRSS